MFIASNYWSGSLNVGNLRSFETEDEAWAYIKSIEGENFFTMFVRVYELSSTKKPRLCKYKGKK